MGLSIDRYWDFAEAAWVPFAAPTETEADADVPPQRTSLEEVEEADVRST